MQGGDQTRKIRKKLKHGCYRVGKILRNKKTQKLCTSLGEKLFRRKRRKKKHEHTHKGNKKRPKLYPALRHRAQRLYAKHKYKRKDGGKTCEKVYLHISYLITLNDLATNNKRNATEEN